MKLGAHAPNKASVSSSSSAATATATPSNPVKKSMSSTSTTGKKKKPTAVWMHGVITKEEAEEFLAKDPNPNKTGMKAFQLMDISINKHLLLFAVSLFYCVAA